MLAKLIEDEGLRILIMKSKGKQNERKVGERKKVSYPEKKMTRPAF